MAEATKRIERALISVFDKTGLEPIVRELHRRRVTLCSTGGTRSFIEAMGIPVVPVEDITAYPSILGGRVKTLHPKVFGGILGRRGLAEDVAQMEAHAIAPIDLVIVDLYPFEATVAAGGSEQDIIEKIDIGGVSLIRAAAKNHADVLIIPAQRHYAQALEIIAGQDGATTLAQRKAFATHAFAETAHYDRAIHGWFSGFDPDAIARPAIGNQPVHPLRYGENPHQPASFLGDLDGLFERLGGKELSYNNLLDLDAALDLIDDLASACTTTAAGPEVPFAILKHNNACGAAIRPTLLAAWEAALAGDPVSAFGGVLVTSATLDTATAQAIDPLFFEIICAPAFEPGALEVLERKKNRILLRRKQASVPPRRLRSALNGLLSQLPDRLTEQAGDMEPATDKAPNATELQDLVFANILVKHTKSNAIVLAKDRQLLGSGTGQTSRVDALEQAIAKAGKFNFNLRGAVMASDAFFPFPDCVAISATAGITAIVQPGGSIRDRESIDACNKLGLAMCITGNRHFKH
ncbi:MAG: bifunctional phosphoribosylaminoimidazolecarboxamide formyltransferase/IMP cyclohydrolase [Flavobacteriales bacterium]|nr:bifunctional phosphoribosylaminoimidazolecarboxamide formyltransferase/IMP cyclohydrolase [Flavobacteriales bacterium]